MKNLLENDCSVCGSEMKIDAISCSGCGLEMSIVKKDTESLAFACPECGGMMVFSGDSICCGNENCGFEIQPYEPTEEE